MFTWLSRMELNLAKFTLRKRQLKYSVLQYKAHGTTRSMI